MAASQDTFGKVFVGFSGNSFVYGKLASSTGPLLPGAPSGLTATAVSGTEIDLSWNAASGTVSSYTVYRGNKAGGESTTALASGVTGTSYKDTAAAAAKEYWYEVAAVNATGRGPDSNEASATTAQPSIALAAASGAPTSITVSRGQTATYQLVLSSSSYAGTITFSCTGAPSGDTCTVPSPVTLTSAIATTPVAISVQTASTNAGLPRASFRGALTVAGALLMVPVLLRRKRRGPGIWMLGIAVLAAALVSPELCGCSRGSGGVQTMPAVTTLTISASGAGLTTATQTLTLTVQ
jgi:hypothetical protein